MGERAEIVRTGFEAFNRRDLDTLLEYCHPDIEWTPPEQLPGSRTYRGHDGVREAIDDMVSVFPDLTAEAVRFIEDGDRVVGLYRWHGRGGESGATLDPFEIKAGFIAEFEDDLLRSARFWLSWEEAAAAAGVDLDALEPAPEL